MKPSFREMSLAVVVPWLMHGAFDWFLTMGDLWTPGISLVILIFSFYLFYRAEDSVSLYSRDLLNILNIDIFDQKIIQKQHLYEGWINDYDSFLKLKPSLLHLKGSLAGYGAVIFFIIVSMIYPLFVHFRGNVFGVSYFEGIAILTILPAAIGLFLFTLEHLNLMFYRDFFVRYPTGAILEMSLVENRNDAAFFETSTGETERESIVVLDYYSTGLFLTAVTGLNIGQVVNIYFSSEGNFARGRVIWMNETQEDLPVGTLVRFEKYGYNMIPVFFKHGMMRLSHRLNTSNFLKS